MQKSVGNAQISVFCRGLLSAVVIFLAIGLAAPKARSDAATSYAQMPEAPAAVSGWADAQDILDRRCVVCHSCYDAPCQLKLTSPAGVLRGASKQVVYHTQRLHDAPPTRLGIDATTEAEWRALGFFSVLRDRAQPAAAPGLLESYLNMGRGAVLPEGQPVPRDLALETDHALACPTPAEFGEVSKNNPRAGMPYATAPLSDGEYGVLMSWAKNAGTHVPAAPPLPDTVAAQVDTWETYLNRTSPQHQLVSRYLYEHLFLARLHFDGDDPRRFFQLVRSKTPPRQPIKIIATRRPFDDPGSDPFYYRLQRVDETIVHKEHLVYALGPDRMARFNTVFFGSDWSVSELPPYGTSEGGNPFSTFAAIPARSRYQFLLDDALFFVRSFIRGPVCHGETAVDVIEDRFWVSFLDPDADLSVTDPAFLAQGAAYLDLPVSVSESGLRGDLQTFSHKNQARYLAFRDEMYRNSPAHRTGLGYDAIWDGDGTNANALITVFRHFDNASAMTGFHGGVPETAWVIDFPVFERIYYDLVAGYDVFGRVEHQLSTRLYMDELRMESEDIFLTFMPRDIRRQMHQGWYRGVLAEVHTYWHRRRVDDTFPAGIAFETTNPKQEFLLTLLQRGKGLWATDDPINRCAAAACAQGRVGSAATALRDIADKSGDWVRFLPDLSLLLVETDGGAPEIFTLVHDKAHSNVAFLFDETARRDPEADVLTIVPGLIGSYPNFFFVVPNARVHAFVQAVTDVGSQDDFVALVAEFGVRRTSADFWATSDRVREAFLRQDPIQAGVLDLNRYKDPKPGDRPE